MELSPFRRPLPGTRLIHFLQAILTVIASTSNSSAPCLGTEYTVAEGDTCESIAEANNVAFYRLLGDNGIDLKCESLTVGTTLCVGDSCTLHTVRTAGNSMCFHEAPLTPLRSRRTRPARRSSPTKTLPSPSCWRGIRLSTPSATISLA